MYTGTLYSTGTDIFHHPKKIRNAPAGYRDTVSIEYPDKEFYISKI
jgi:hypothetical protein